MLNESGSYVYGLTLFCDDIRPELSGQTTYVGVYGDVVYVPGGLPKILPSLSMVIHLFSNDEDAPKSLEIVVQMPGQSEQEAKIFNIMSHEDIAKVEAISVDDAEYARTHFVINVKGGRAKIEQYGNITVKAKWDGRSVLVGTLAILQDNLNSL